MKKIEKTFQSPIADKKLNELLTDDVAKEKEFNKKVLWYHGRSINRKKTETLLMSKDVKSGTFLVRDSFSSHGDFVLSVRYDIGKNKPAVEHFKIFRNPNDCYYKLDRNKEHEVHGLENLIELYQRERHGLPVQLDKYIPLNPPPPESRQLGRTNILHLAITGGVLQNVISILKHKKCPNMNSRDSAGTPVLYMACEAGMTEAVEIMLKLQVKVFTKNTEGYSALHVACKTDRADIVTLLLDIGHASPVDICKHNRYSPMHTAAVEGSLDCLRVLLKYGAPDRPRDINRCIPYELAKEHNRVNIIRFLDTYETVVDPVINKKDWFHEQRTRPGSQLLFQKLGTTDGIFLIRKRAEEDSFALSLCFEQQIFHYKIRVMRSLVYYIDDGPMMTSLERIVSHYLRFSDGLPCRLKTAVSATEILMDLEVFTGDEPEREPDPWGLSVSDQMIDGADGGDTTPPLYDVVGSPEPPPIPASRSLLSTNKSKTGSLKDPLSAVLIDKKNIQLGHELGQGEFGSVLKGIYTKHEALRKKHVNVAVKTLLDSPLTGSKEDFLMEARVMLELDHPNVVKLIGVCEGPPVMIIQELVKMGSMLDYLWDYEDEIQVDTDLILWAVQIANGMKYLEEKKFVHRDLAARNILLAEKTLAKISDFGLSRAVGSGSDYYKASKGGRWPVKWYAPESVNYGTFSHASDVWSFGITLYEMFTFGEQPYGEKSGAEVIQMLERGFRLDKPPKCPAHVYALMKKCWSANAAERPTFQGLCTSFAADPSFSRAKSIVGQQKKGKFKLPG